MAHFHHRGSRRLMAEMNVVPFIDVMLVLLVIFMITTPLLTQGVKVNLPQTESKPLTEDQKQPIIVTVDAQGSYFLNIAEKPAQPITDRVLSNLVTERLNSVKGSAEQPPVLVRGDQSTNYGKVVAAMVLLQQAGAKSVGLITSPIQNNKPAS